MVENQILHGTSELLSLRLDVAMLETLHAKLYRDAADSNAMIGAMERLAQSLGQKQSSKSEICATHATHPPTCPARRFCRYKVRRARHRPSVVVVVLAKYSSRNMHR
jgi:hypothetical protein